MSQEWAQFLAGPRPTTWVAAATFLPGALRCWHVRSLKQPGPESEFETCSARLATRDGIRYDLQPTEIKPAGLVRTMRGPLLDCPGKFATYPWWPATPKLLNPFRFQSAPSPAYGPSSVPAWPGAKVRTTRESAMAFYQNREFVRSLNTRRCGMGAGSLLQGANPRGANPRDAPRP